MTENKKFGELDINSYFKIGDITFLKKTTETARNMSTGKIVELPLYEEVTVDKHPTYVLNY